MNPYVQEALQWLGTPFHLNAAIRGVGCDCYGLVVGVWQAVHRVPVARPPELYAVNPQHIKTMNKNFLTHGDLFCERLSVNFPEPGDIQAFCTKGSIIHIGIIINDHSFIHADSRNNRGVVCARRDSRPWLGRGGAVFRYRQGEPTWHQ